MVCLPHVEYECVIPQRMLGYRRFSIPKTRRNGSGDACGPIGYRMVLCGGLCSHAGTVDERSESR
ncbi:protein of unknown function [Nitrospira japonica]|uniref:Uncharacterized protein n=1 Tax=Nitrospira japonica TaxID=1325564 RepID=A0A1W1I486_9BACT|nr:protein of unknown function [Nitrospira japonica]